MSKQQLVKISKFLSLVLRHKPEAIGLQLDKQGWADIEKLIDKANQSGEITGLDASTILEVVRTSDKQRFALSDDGKHIRANQGHSVAVDLQLTPKQPPNILYHGTASHFLASIKAEGLKSGQRQHVHLSQNTETATQVGQRYGKPIVLTIDAKTMHQQGITFYQANNGVWLTHRVSPQFIKDQLMY